MTSHVSKWKQIMLMSANEPKFDQRSLNKHKGAWMSLNKLKLA